MIDDQLLVIGGLNPHYSSFGESGLLEFNAATTSPEALDPYQKMFDYYWQRAISAQEALWKSTGNQGYLVDRIGIKLAVSRFSYYQKIDITGSAK